MEECTPDVIDAGADGYSHDAYVTARMEQIDQLWYMDGMGYARSTFNRGRCMAVPSSHVSGGEGGGAIVITEEAPVEIGPRAGRERGGGRLVYRPVHTWRRGSAGAARARRPLRHVPGGGTPRRRDRRWCSVRAPRPPLRAGRWTSTAGTSCRNEIFWSRRKRRLLPPLPRPRPRSSRGGGRRCDTSGGTHAPRRRRAKSARGTATTTPIAPPG